MRHFSKRRKAKRTRIRKRGTLRIEDARDIIAYREAEKMAQRDKRSREGNQGEGQPTTRRCSTCRKTSHNARTCKKDVDMPSSVKSEESE